MSWEKKLDGHYKHCIRTYISFNIYDTKNGGTKMQINTITTSKIDV